MELIHSILVTVYIIVSVSIIILVLLQHGKGASTGASFGSGASGSLFGASGSANFLSRTTAAMISLFFIISLTLSFISMNDKIDTKGSVIDKVKTPATLNPSTPSKGFSLPSN